MLVLKSQKKPFFVKKTLQSNQLSLLQSQKQSNGEQHNFDENSNENEIKQTQKTQETEKWKPIGIIENNNTIFNQQQNCQQNINIEMQRKRNPQKLLQPLQTLDPSKSIDRANQQNQSIVANSTKHEQFMQYHHPKKIRGGQKLSKLNQINFNDKDFTPWESKNTVDLLDVCQEQDFISCTNGLGADRYFNNGYNKNHHHQFNLKQLKLNNIDEEEKSKGINNKERYQQFQFNINRARLNDSFDSNGNSISSNSNLLNFSNQLKTVATHKQLINHHSSQDAHNNDNYSQSSQINNQGFLPTQPTSINNDNIQTNTGRIQNLAIVNNKGRCKSVIKDRRDQILLNNNSFNQHNLTINTDNIPIQNLTTIRANHPMDNLDYDGEGFLNQHDVSQRLQTFDETTNRQYQQKRGRHVKALSIISQNFSEIGNFKDSISSYQTLKQHSLGRQQTPGGNSQNQRPITYSRNISINGDTPNQLRANYTPLGLSSLRGEKGLQDRGNTSFINCAIQIFRHLDLFNQEIINYETSEGGNPPFIFFLKNIFKDLNDNKEPTKYTQFINFIYTTSNQFKRNETGEVDNFIEYIIQESLTTLIKFQQTTTTQNISQNKHNNSSIQQGSNSHIESGFDQNRFDQSNDMLSKHSINILPRPKQSKMHNLFGSQSQDTQIDSSENDNFDVFTQNECCFLDSSEFGIKKVKHYGDEGQLAQQNNSTINLNNSKRSLEELKSKAILQCLSDFKEMDKQIIDIYNKFLQSIEYQNILSICSLFFGVSKVTYYCINCKKCDDTLNDINLFKIIKIYDDSEFSLEDRISQTGFFQYHFCKSCKIETKFIQKLVYYTLPKYLFISIQKQSTYKLQFCSSGVQPLSQPSASKKTVKSVLDTQNLQIETIYKNQIKYSLKGQILNQQGSTKFSSLILAQQGTTREEPLIYLFNDQYLKQRNKFATENVKIIIYERVEE